MPVTATPAVASSGGCTDNPVLPGAKVPAPLPVSCMNQHIVCARTPTEPVKGTPVLSRTHAIQITGEKKTSIDWVMRDVNGQVVDLRDCLCDDEGGSLSASSSESDSDCACTYDLTFRMGEYLKGGGCEFAVEVIDAATGHVRVNLEAKDTGAPGVYFGEFAIVECNGDPDTEDPVIFSNNMYIIIGRNLWSTRMVGSFGPPSISEIRLHLRDTEPSESFLLDNLAFSDEEIAQAIYLPIQYWNEIPPPVTTYTTTNFPHRYHWLMAISGYLFMTVAEQQRRNNLQYAASGVQVNDQNREANYQAAAQRRLDEWRSFVRFKKVEINTELGFGGIGSPYQYGGY